MAAGKVERGAGAITDWSVSAKVLAANVCVPIPSRGVCVAAWRDDIMGSL